MVKKGDNYQNSLYNHVRTRSVVVSVIKEADGENIEKEEVETSMREQNSWTVQRRPIVEP